MQNPPTLLPKMINLWREGNDVVLPRLKKDLEKAPSEALLPEQLIK